MNILHQLTDLVPYEYRYMYESIPTVYKNKTYMFYWKESEWKIGEINEEDRKVSEWTIVSHMDVYNYAKSLQVDLVLLETRLRSIIFDYAYYQHTKGNEEYVDKVREVFGEKTISDYFDGYKAFEKSLIDTVKRLLSKPKLQVVK